MVNLRSGGEDFDAKWRRQGGCRGGSVDGWENGMCGIDAKSLEVEEAARGWS